MIISPLKVWVQNILPAVYDDSLSYLEIVAKINAKTNEIISQTNENTHAIETLASTIAELGDIEELRALLDEIQTVIEDLYSTDAPLMDGNASAGSADHAARCDHVHPSDTSKLNKNDVANSEDGDSAINAYSAGEFLIRNGTLYKVLNNISVGDNFIVGTNIELSEIGNELTGLKTLINKQAIASNLNGSSLENIKSSLLTLAENQIDKGVIPVNVWISGDSKPFITGATYIGFLMIASKSINGLYFEASLVSYTGHEIIIGYSNGSWNTTQAGVLPIDTKAGVISGNCQSGLIYLYRNTVMATIAMELAFAGDITTEYVDSGTERYFKIGKITNENVFNLTPGTFWNSSLETYILCITPWLWNMKQGGSQTVFNMSCYAMFDGTDTVFFSHVDKSLFDNYNLTSAAFSAAVPIK